MMEMGERAEKVSQGWGEMPLYWWCKQLWGGNTDRSGGKSKSRMHKKSSTRSGSGGEKQKDPEGEEQCWLKIKTCKSLAGKPGTLLQHG